MEAFVRHVPNDTSELRLRKRINRVVKHLNLSAWHASKLRNKSCAVITFLRPEDAARFLEYCEEPGLVINGETLICAESVHTPKPQLLSVLQKEHDDQKLVPANQRIPTNVQILRLTRIECGHYFYAANGDLRFGTQWGKSVLGSLTMANGQLVVLMEHDVPREDAIYRSTNDRYTRYSGSLATEKKQHALYMRFAEIENIIYHNDGEYYLHVTLRIRPRIYEISAKKEWDQTQDYSDDDDRYDTVTSLARVSGIDDGHIDVAGVCLVYRLQVSAQTRAEVLKFVDGEGTPTSISRTIPSFDAPGFRISEESLIQSLVDLFQDQFCIRFQLHRLFLNIRLFPIRLEGLLKTVQSMITEHGASLVADAIRRFGNLVPVSGPDVKLEERTAEKFKSLLQRCLDDSRQSLILRDHLREDLTFVHQVSVTPTGLLLSGPWRETKNQVLNRYKDHVSNHFICVDFVDENGEHLKHDKMGSLDKVLEKRVLSVLKDGILIGGTPFEFLGFSSIKEMKCWMVSTFKHNGQFLSRQQILAQMGDFSRNRSVPECTASVGQLFADATYGNIVVSPNEVRIIPDVERNGHVFSSGCGTISSSMLSRFRKELTKPPPTLFTIKYRGATGILSLDTTLQGDQVRLRPSMIKFVSPHSEVGIRDAATQPSPFFLDQHVTLLLQSLGVPAENLHCLQASCVDKLRDITKSLESTQKFLQESTIGCQINLSWFIEKLQSIGIGFRADNFLNNCIETPILAQFRDIKYAAKIPVPDAWSLYGIMDETGFLQEGQIYCSVAGRVLIGKLFVLECPTLLTDDIQEVLAVQPPEGSPLLSLHNCLVFSSQGNQDLASMLGHRDSLEKFHVLQEESLFPTEISAPEKYDREKPSDIKRAVTTPDIIKFFIEFTKQDQSDRIASQHLQTVDHEEWDSWGVRAPHCKTIAKLYRQAADFAQTGINAKLDDLPKPPMFFPDFMGPETKIQIVNGRIEIQKSISDGHFAEVSDSSLDLYPGVTRVRYYKSDKALGDMFRAIDEQEFLDHLRSTRPEIPADSDGNACMQKVWSYVKQEVNDVAYSDLIPWAKGVRQQYENAMLDIMQQFGTEKDLLEEVEVFTGTVLSLRGSRPTSQDRKRLEPLKDRYDRMASYIVTRIKQGQYETVDGSGDTVATSEDALKRSLACFEVAMDQTLDRSVGKRGPLRSFLIIAASVCLQQLERRPKFQGRTESPVEEFHDASEDL